MRLSPETGGAADQRPLQADNRYPPATPARRGPDNPRMRQRAVPTPPVRGFTVVELLVAVAIMALLAALAVPSYQSAIRKSRRSDATSALSALMQAQERYRAASSAYAPTLKDLGATDTTANKYYTLSIPKGANATDYAVKATANTDSSQASDAGCQGLLVTVTKGQITYGSTDADGTANAVDKCWQK